MQPENFIRARLKIDLFNRDRIFTINKQVQLDNGIYYYWLKENGREIIGRFLKEELFALNDQFN